MSDAARTAVLRRDRAIAAACLVVLILLAWVYIVWLADDMEMGGMDMTGFRMIPAGSGLMMPVDAPWHAIEFAFVFAMWAVMMIGMMTPSATLSFCSMCESAARLQRSSNLLRRALSLRAGTCSHGPLSLGSQRSANGRSSGWAYSRPRWQVQAVPLGG